MHVTVVRSVFCALLYYISFHFVHYSDIMGTQIKQSQPQDNISWRENSVNYLWLYSNHYCLITLLCGQIYYRPVRTSVCGSMWAVSAKGLAEAKGRLRGGIQEADIQDTNAASGFCPL